MERCEARARAQRARRRKASADGCASRRSIPSGFSEGNENEGAPRALQTTGAAERWLNSLRWLFDN
jgi:hypothetical protein